MNDHRPLSTWVGLGAATVFAAWVSSCFGARSAGAEPAPAGTTATATASVTGAPAESGEPRAPAKAAIRISEYSWPTEASPEPAEAEWASATELEAGCPRSYVQPTAKTCVELVAREWVRIACPPPDRAPAEPELVGVVWGLAGDLSGVKAKITPATTLERFKAPTQDVVYTLLRRAGASAAITFQLRPGTAFLASIGRVDVGVGGWDASVSVGLREGPVIDVSWAKGERAPTIVCR